MNDLHETARTLLAPGKATLAADESTGTITKRLDPIGHESTQESRRAHRELPLGTAAAEAGISGASLFDETSRQTTSPRTPRPKLLEERGIIPGIKEDRGAQPPALAQGETITEGLDGLRSPPSELAVMQAPASAVDLDSVSAHWRVVFNMTEDALRAASRCGKSLSFAETELHALSSQLALERAETAELLDEVAREEHLDLSHRLSAPRATRRTLGLPANLAACVFDLDGVLTASGELHAAAWAETFDEFLARRVELTGERFAPFRPFDPRVDYLRHINGRPRLDGVHAFLASRGIRLPDGRSDDPPDTETIHGLANRKQAALLHLLEREDVTAFAGARRYLEDALEAGLRCAVVSPSTNTGAILDRAGLASLIEERVDGNTIQTEQLVPKPAPDTLLAACRRLGSKPSETAAFETTSAGITAARTAGFGLVVAIDRSGRAETLSAHGADLVIADLGALLNSPVAFNARSSPQQRSVNNPISPSDPSVTMTQES